jgi:5-formyltetrahydrofolate cyclo-ligase
VRETKRFDSLFALKSQIHLDVVHARKFFIRETIRVHWDMLPQTEREQLSKSAVARVSELPEFQSSTFVYLFAPDTREINFVQQLCSEFNDKIYAFPRIEEKKINFYSSRFEDLREGKFRILEPVGDVSASSPDLILVPAVAAAITGERLGRGGGFYDAFLAQVDAPTVCVLPEWAVLNDVPFEAHDQRVGKVIGV